MGILTFSQNQYIWAKLQAYKVWERWFYFVLFFLVFVEDWQGFFYALLSQTLFQHIPSLLLAHSCFVNSPVKPEWSRVTRSCGRNLCRYVKTMITTNYKSCWQQNWWAQLPRLGETESRLLMMLFQASLWTGNSSLCPLETSFVSFWSTGKDSRKLLASLSLNWIASHWHRWVQNCLRKESLFLTSWLVMLPVPPIFH